MERKTLYILIAAALLVVLLGALIVWRSATGSLEQIEGPKMATVGAQVNGQMMEGYPQAVPKWEGATVVSSDHVMRTDFDVYDLTLITTDSFDDVVNGYLNGLQKAGFNRIPHDIGTMMTSIEASSTEHAATFVFFTDDSGQTGITASIRTFR